MRIDVREALLIVNGRGSELDFENAPSISEALLALDDSLELPNEKLPSQLRHYLERRSYQKALDYVENHSITF